MTTSARPFPFRSPSFPPVRFHSSGLSAPVAGRFLFLPSSFASLSFRSGQLPDTQLPVLPFGPPSVPPPSGFPNAPSFPFSPLRFSPSLPPGFPFGTSGSAYSALLFVSFRSSLIRSHSRSSGAALTFRILLPIFQASSVRPFVPLPPSFRCPSASLPSV